MKIPNEQGIQQIAYNHSSDIDIKNFLKLYKNVLQDHIFLVIDGTLASNNSLHFRKNLVGRIQKIIMTIADKIRLEKL